MDSYIYALLARRRAVSRVSGRELSIGPGHGGNPLQPAPTGTNRPALRRVLAASLFCQAAKVFRPLDRVRGQGGRFGARPHPLARRHAQRRRE